jgi:hypothetical protein
MLVSIRKFLIHIGKSDEEHLWLDLPVDSSDKSIRT